MSDLRMELIQGQLNDIEESVRSIKTTWGNTIMTLDNIKSSLKANRQQAVEEAYQRGLDEGKKQAKVQAHLDVCHDIERVAHGNYQKGLDDAWECARKIAQEWEENAETEHRIVIDDSIRTTLDSMTASEAISKLKAYEQQKADAEIKVGDEIEDETGEKLVIAYIDPSTKSVCAIGGDGHTYGFFAGDYKKTGKTYPQVEELLKAMKGEQISCSTCKYSDGSDVSKCSDCFFARGYIKWEPKEGAE